MRKAAKQDFDELHKRGQENLVRFLRLEIELGQTMGQISETTERAGVIGRVFSAISEKQLKLFINSRAELMTPPPGQSLIAVLTGFSSSSLPKAL
jgi:hypothetical protein